MEVYVKEAWKPNLHFIALTGGSVACSGHHSSSLFKHLSFIPFRFSHSHEIARLLQNSWRELLFCCSRHFGEDLIKHLIVSPELWVKTFTGVFTFFLLLTSVHWFKQENLVASYSINKHKLQTFWESKLFV